MVSDQVYKEKPIRDENEQLVDWPASVGRFLSNQAIKQKPARIERGFNATMEKVLFQ